MLFSSSLLAHFDSTFGFTSIALSTSLYISLRIQLRIHFQMHFYLTFEFTSISRSNSLQVHFDVTLAFTSTVWHKHQVLYCTVLHCNHLWFWDRRFFKMLGIGTSHKRLLYCTVLYCTCLYDVCPMWSNAIFLLCFREQATMDGDCVQMKQPQQYS